jgi:hypothetical protein
MTERRRTEERVRSALRELEAPDERMAEERARHVVKTAFDGYEPAAPPSRAPRRAAIAVLAAAAVAGFFLTPAGADVREWIAETIEPGEEDAEPKLTSLPTPGSVLVEAPSGAWTIREDGAKRRLGDYDRATWSPNGRFVGVASGTELRAVDPAGNFRWSIESPMRIDGIDWSSDEGFRVAYLAGETIRIVAGDGTGDRILAKGVKDVTPAWRPEDDASRAIHELTYVDAANRVVLIDADSERVLWRTNAYTQPVRSLEWSADGERLLVVGGDFATIQDDEGGSYLKGPIATSVRHAAISADGTEIAVVSAGKHGTELSLYSDTAPVERLYASGRKNPDARFGAPVFSPDGGWVLLPWPEADQWLFVNMRDERVTAVADIARQFGAGGDANAGFPKVVGWCC